MRDEIIKLAKELTEEEKRNKEEKKKKKEEKKIKRKERVGGYVEAYLGTGAATLGKKVLNEARDSGDLDGRVKLYHATKKENIPSILENGLQGSRTNRESFTRKFMEGQGISKDQWEPFKNKSYLAKSKSATKGVIANRAGLDAMNVVENNGVIDKSPFNAMFGTQKELHKALKNYKVLKASIPKAEYKNLKTVANPELLGAKNVDELVEKKPMLAFYPKSYQRKAFKALNDDSVTIDGDFDAKYFKGGKGYVKNSPKQVLNHIKNNPKDFSKALGKSALGVGAMALGAYGTVKGVKRFINAKKTARKKMEEKEASSMNDFNEIEKTAKNRYMRYLDEAGSTGEMIRRMKKLKIKGATPNGLRRSMANEMGVNDTFGNKIIKSNFKQPEKMPSKLRMTINEYAPRDNNYDYPSKMLTKDSINRMQEMKHVMGLNTGSELYRGFNRSDKKLKELLNQTYKDRGRSGRLYALSRGTGLESKFIRRNFNDLRQNVQNGEPFRKLQKAENIAKRRKKIKRLPSNYTILNEKAV